MMNQHEMDVMERLTREANRVHDVVVRLERDNALLLKIEHLAAMSLQTDTSDELEAALQDFRNRERS